MSVYVSSLLTATAATVNADPASTRTWQWQRNGVNIPGATNSTYSAAPADIGSNLFVVQTETNFLGSNNASASVGPVVAFSPIALFQDGSQGWWYDDNDTTTLFQDSAGTTPVTAVEQFVGLQLDKSKGLVLGPELVTNGSFTTDTDWTKGVGWTISGGAANANIATGSNLDQTATTTSGKFYAVTYTVLSYVSGGVRVRFTGTANVNGTVRSANGTYTEYINATATNNVIRFTDGGAGFVGSIDNISVRELPGNHRYAPASGNRPIWSKRVNQLLQSQAFDVTWANSRTVVTANSTTAPDGSLTADTIAEDNQTGATGRSQAVSTIAGATYTFSCFLKNIDRQYVQLTLYASSTANYISAAFDLVAQTSTTAANGTGYSVTSASIVDVGNGWFRCSITGVVGTTPAAAAAISPRPNATAGGFPNYAGTTLAFNAWGADLRPANQATGLLPLYQRVNTSTDYETNGFPGYLKADGVDDFLQTNTINFGDGPTNPPLGPELVTNGDFSQGTTGWGTFFCSIAVSGGEATLTSNAGAAFPQITQTISGLTVGRSYLMTGTARRGTTVDNAYISPASGISVQTSSTSATALRVMFVATATSTSIGLGIFSGSTNGTAVFDNISVKEITNANLGADKITLCAGVRKLSDAALGVATELSATIASNNGTFVLEAPAGASPSFNFASKGTTLANNTAQQFIAPITQTVTGIGDIAAARNTIRIGGVEAGVNTATQGTGNYGNYPAYFFQRNGPPAANRFNGYEYSNIAVGKLLTASQLASLEQYTYSKTINADGAIYATQAGFSWNSAASPPNSTTYTGSRFITPTHEGMRRCLLLDNGTVNYYLDPNDSTKKADGTAATLTGADGQVMVEIPAFYTKRTVVGTTTTWEISSVPATGFTLHPAFTKDGVDVAFRYYGAYDACVYDVSASAYISGLNWDNNSGAGNGVAVDVTASTGDVLASVSGVYPMVGLQRTEFRTIAANRGSGWRQVDWTLWSAVQLLYLIEYQTFFSQNVLGAGNTGTTYAASSGTQTDNGGSEAGKSNSIGNASSNVTTGASSASRQVAWMSYRGIENFYGNAWNWADGVIVNPDGTASAGQGDWWFTNNVADFSDTVRTNMTQITNVAATASGFISAIASSDNFFVGTSTSGGSSTTFLTDQLFPSTGADRVVLVGSSADNGADAGAFCVLASFVASNRVRSFGARLAF